MLEHIVVAQIMDHLDHHKIIHENQHGFRSRRSCESQLLLTTDDIVRSINQSHQVDMAILDLAKAFDKYVFKRISFGSKDCTKELKPECAYFLGQTS